MRPISFVAALVVSATLFTSTPSFAGDRFSALADSSRLPEGFVELRMVAGGGVTAAYQYKDSRITVETRRGPKTPAELRLNDPNAPQFEIDIRLVDEQGFPFFVQYGGHGPIEPTWRLDYNQSSDPLLKALANPSDQQARSAFRAAEHALLDLSKLNLNKGLDPEYRALINLLPTIQSMMVVEKIEQPSATNSDDAQVAAPASACTYKHKIAIYSQPCCANSVTGAYHSGTIAQNISSSGQTTQAWAACNHGTCPSLMPLKCSWTSTANRCALRAVAVCTSNYSIFGGCKTHVCNDDSKMQFDGVKGSYTPAPNTPTCIDCTLRKTAPTC